MRTLLLAGSSLLMLAVSVTAVPTARAAYIVTFSEAGPDVVASGSGTIDVNGLTFFGLSASVPPQVGPFLAEEVTGATSTVDAYEGAISGPSSFGSGAYTLATTGTGGQVAIQAPGGVVGSDFIYLPQGYVSGAALFDTATYAGQSFATLGLTPGSYIYSLGSGENADTFTVDVSATAPVPEPASLALFGTGLAALGLIRRRRRG